MLLPTGAGGFGTSPFDGEGLPSQRTVVVENGVLRNYLLNTYTARKLGMKSTHNASRGLAGTPGIGCGNLYLEPGTLTPEEIIADVPAGLYVTSLMGFGTNIVTGDYSRGATGLWIENGQLTHAVEEVTIAGNLAEMLTNVTAIGNDLVFRGSVASPTLRIDGMTIARSLNREVTGRADRPQTLAFDPADAKAALAQLPRAAAVFALYGAEAHAEPYIGRTPNLRGRLERLLQPSPKHPRRLQLAGRVRRIAWRLTGSEFESLLLQFSLLEEVYGAKALERMHLRRSGLCALSGQQSPIRASR